MRAAFAHDAVVVLVDGGDPRTPGAAITVALCGHWDHEPPCPLAPHYTGVEQDGDEVRLRVLFAAEPAAEDEVRAKIEDALARGVIEGPGGVVTRWEFRGARPGAVRDDEAEHAGRLIRS